MRAFARVSITPAWASAASASRRTLRLMPKSLSQSVRSAGSADLGAGTAGRRGRATAGRRRRAAGGAPLGAPRRATPRDGRPASAGAGESGVTAPRVLARAGEAGRLTLTPACGSMVLPFDQQTVPPGLERSQQDGNSGGHGPRAKRTAGCLCFDFDALSPLPAGRSASIGGTPSRAGSSARPSPSRAIWRGSTPRHDLRATWFVPAHTEKNLPRRGQGARRHRGHEVAAHNTDDAPYEVGLATSGVPSASSERQRG